jgi:hypothetical protein
MRSQYKVERYSYIPSVFGDNKVDIKPIKIENSDNYFKEIARDI